MKTHVERENDALTKTLQTKEQQGHVHGVSSKLTRKEGFPEHKSMYRKRKMTSTPQLDVEELKIQLKRVLLGDLKLKRVLLGDLRLMSEEERRSSLASIAAIGGGRP
jgi:hypothetical protein